MEESTIIEEKTENGTNTEEFEVLENEATTETESISQETVSMGDYLPSLLSDTVSEALTVEDITLAVETALVEEYGLFDKPLEEYTVSESLLLILVLCALGLVIEKIIGGILNCTRLFKK